MTSDTNFVFVCDTYATLSVFEISSNKIHIKRANQKINFTNITSISLNSIYFGVTYSSLNDYEIKKYGKDLSRTGICLFSRSGHFVSNILCRFISKKSGFYSPRGLVLTEDYLYVGDNKEKDYGKIYKFDFDGKILQKFSMQGRIHDISLNTKFLVFTDKCNHKLNLVDLKSMKDIKDSIIGLDNEFDDGPLSIVIINDYLIFLINEVRGGVFLFNTNLDFITRFSISSQYFYDLVVLDSPNQSLIIGNKAKNSGYKLSCFFLLSNNFQQN
jgi:hypothetical protein